MSGIIEQNLEEISYEHMVIRLHLGTNNVYSGPFSIYGHRNATLQPRYSYYERHGS